MEMNREVIVTCAVTGAGDTVGKHPDVPVTPEQIGCRGRDRPHPRARPGNGYWQP